MAFNVRELTTEIKDRGYLKTNKFVFNCQIPPGFGRYKVEGFAEFYDTARRIELYGEASHLPGLLHATDDIRRYGYGPLEKKPFAPIFRDLPLTFREDGEGSVYRFFMSWMRMSLLYETREQDITSTSGSVPGQNPYEVAYKEDYVQDVTVTVFDDAGVAQVQMILKEAYPVFVGDVPLNWANKRELLKIPVVLTFFDMYQAQVAPPSATSS